MASAQRLKLEPEGRSRSSSFPSHCRERGEEEVLLIGSPIPFPTQKPGLLGPAAKLKEQDLAFLHPLPHPVSRANMCDTRCHGARERQKQVQVEKHMAEIRNENHMSQPGRKAVTYRL